MDKIKNTVMPIIGILVLLFCIFVLLAEVTATRTQLPPELYKYSKVKQVSCYPRMIGCSFIYQDNDLLLEESYSNPHERFEVTFVFKTTNEPTYVIKTEYYNDIQYKLPKCSAKVKKKVEYTFYMNDADKIQIKPHDKE